MEEHNRAIRLCGNLWHHPLGIHRFCLCAVSADLRHQTREACDEYCTLGTFEQHTHVLKVLTREGMMSCLSELIIINSSSYKLQ